MARVPEPTSTALLALGAVCALLRRRRSKEQQIIESSPRSRLEQGLTAKCYPGSRGRAGFDYRYFFEGSGSPGASSKPHLKSYC